MTEEDLLNPGGLAFRQNVPSDEDLIRLMLSLEDLTGVSMREIRCPYCQFLMEKVGSDLRTGHKEVKCGKCKAEFVIDYRYFRSAKCRYNYFGKRVLYDVA